MAVPSDPTVASIVTEGMRRGGKVNPSATEITSATDNQLQEVKADIMLVVGEHYLFDTADVVVTVSGQKGYAFPAGMHGGPLITVLDGPDDWRGTAQAGASTTITLAATFDEDEERVIASDIITTGGTGSLQIKNIVAYNNTTKVATVDSAWDTNPDNTTTYLVANWQESLGPRSKEFDYNEVWTTAQTGRPECFALRGQTAFVFPTPDKVYALKREYTLDLDRLDEATDFIPILRKWRSVFIQGIAVKTMQRYDDERYPTEFTIYQNQLTRLQHQAAKVGQVRAQDV